MMVEFPSRHRIQIDNIFMPYIHQRLCLRYVLPPICIVLHLSAYTINVFPNAPFHPDLAFVALFLVPDWLGDGCAGTSAAVFI